MFTKSRRPLLLLFLALACTLSIPACKSVSTMPSVKPTLPVVRCKQPDVPALAPAPRADEWVQYLPPMPGAVQGMAVLSERAATWVIDALTANKKLRGLRQVEHGCLDNAEKKGLIRQ